MRASRASRTATNEVGVARLPGWDVVLDEGDGDVADELAEGDDDADSVALSVTVAEAVGDVPARGVWCPQPVAASTVAAMDTKPRSRVGRRRSTWVTCDWYRICGPSSITDGQVGLPRVGAGHCGRDAG